MHTPKNISVANIRITEVISLVKILREELNGRHESTTLENTIRNVINDAELFLKLTGSKHNLEFYLTDETTSTLEIASRIAKRIKSIARHFQKSAYSKLSDLVSDQLMNEGIWLDKFILNPDTIEDPPELETKTKFQIMRASNLAADNLNDQIKALIENLENKALESTIKYNKLNENFNTLEERAKSEIEKINKTYDEVVHDINQKNDQINDVLDLVSTRFISADYDKSVQNERATADWLRYGSLACMTLIAVMLGYTFWETTNTEFSWQKSIFRITLTFLLSVPAAYLARESAKHREQQYHHLQTSLDMKAIPSFMSSLPVEEQNKFKLAIANKIFAQGKTRDKTDSYPINVQELLMALLKKIEDVPSPKKTISKADNSESQSNNSTS